MTQWLEKHIAEGRGTPGPKQANDAAIKIREETEKKQRGDAMKTLFHLSGLCMNRTSARPSLRLLPPMAGMLFLFCVFTVFGEFAHPGVSYSAGSIAFVRSKINAGEQPWVEAWSLLTNSPEADLSWKPNPIEHVERGPSNNPNIGSSDFSADGVSAQVHAVCWALTRERAHAEKAAEILDAWSGTLKSISNHDARLLVGMSGDKFIIAAELLKHTWDGWPAARQKPFARMLREIWYPLIKDFYPSANGNWDAAMLQAMIGMGVFLDDQTMFDRAKDYFLRGEGNGAIGNYFKESGQCQETGRDQAHTQMGLDFLAATCETAWIQGVDLYGALDDRLLKGFEYTSKYNLGFNVPYEPYRSFQGRYYYERISDNSRGRFRPMYERVFNHYHNRKGLEATYTWQAVERLREVGEAGGRSERGEAGEASQREAKSRRPRSRAQVAIDTLMFAGHPASFPSAASSDEKSPAIQRGPLKPDRVIAYKTVGDVTFKLHVFEPAGLKRSDRRAAIVFFFGGGWTDGDPKQFYQQSRTLAEQEMVAFSAEYRVSSRNKTTPLECVKDAKSALRWVRAHAAELGVDPNRIAAAGGSAGGHIAACTGVIEGQEEAGEDLKVSSVPNALILFNPVTDTTSTGFGSHRFKPELQQALSPCHHVRKGLPPTLVFHGTADKTVPFENAERFARLMQEAGNDCVLVPFQGRGHGFFNGTLNRPKSDGADYELTLNRSIAFLKAHGLLPALKTVRYNQTSREP